MKETCLVSIWAKLLGFIVNNIIIIYYYYDHGLHMKKSMLKYYYLDL
jgi:hypothetical protein